MYHDEIKQIEELIAQLKVPESATIYLSPSLYCDKGAANEISSYSLYISTDEQKFGNFLTIVAEPFNLFIETLKQTIQEQKE